MKVGQVEDYRHKWDLWNFCFLPQSGNHVKFTVILYAVVTSANLCFAAETTTSELYITRQALPGETITSGNLRTRKAVAETSESQPTMTREERIKAHRDQIETIIAENRRKQVTASRTTSGPQESQALEYSQVYGSVTPEDERKMTREERIKAHHDRIEKIIAENKRKQEMARSMVVRPQDTAGLEYFKVYGPHEYANLNISTLADQTRNPNEWSGFRVRVAEGLTPADIIRLMDQLEADGFKNAFYSGDAIEQQGDVFIECARRTEAEEILKRLKDRDYQFHSIRWGPIVERQSATSVTLMNTGATDQPTTALTDSGRSK